MQDWNGKTFFVFSTARSGSTSLSQYLSYAKNAFICHEPPGTQPYNDSVVENQKLGEPISKKEIFEVHRKEGIDKILEMGLMFGELTPTLCYVAEGILECYPDSKVVWLLRDPRYWLRSALHVNFQMGHVRRCCWYWNKQVALIQAGYLKAKKSNRCMVKVENLTPEGRVKLYEWLGLEPTHEGVLEWMRKDFRLHPYVGPKWFPHPDDWGEEEWEPFNTFIRDKHEALMKMYEVEKLI